MKTIQTYIILIIASTLLACNKQTQESERVTNQSASDTAYVESILDQSEVIDNSSSYGNEGSEIKLPIETRIRFQNFSVVVHNFKGYDTDGELGNRTYSGQFGGGSGLNEAYLNDGEAENEGYIETLVVLKDSVHLSESLGGNDNKINSTLFQILPNDKNNRFVISYCYLTNLCEMFDNKKLNEEKRNKLYENRFLKKEKSELIPLKDSANFYFPLTLLNNHNDQAWYINGTMSKSFYQKDLNRIKTKYNLKDTLIMFSSEGGSYYATLTKDKRIFGYDTESYLICVDRYTSDKLAETKYIVINIAYGC